MKLKLKHTGFARGLQQGSDQGTIWLYDQLNRHIGTISVTYNSITVHLPSAVELRVTTIEGLGRRVLGEKVKTK